MLKIPGVYIRRPLSIFAAGRGKVEFLYKVFGKGTRSLSRLRPGGQLKVLGPLGNGFGLKAAGGGVVPVFVGGGTGFASLSFLAGKFSGQKIMLFGSKCEKDLVKFVKKSGRSRTTIKIATEDGSVGLRGYVTDLLEDFLSARAGKKYMIFACGPKKMLEKIKQISLKYKVPGFVSYEEVMACGLGICQGCAVKVNGAYKTACVDGPVFDLSDIEF
jgi:dihydroorotate dehydrogenase electron transfer subunit